MFKKILAVVIFSFVSTLTLAQGSSVIRGEVSPGVYTNFAADSSGYAQVNIVNTYVTEQLSIIATGTYSASRNSATQLNSLYTGVNIICNVTAVTALQNIIFMIQYLDSSDHAVTVIDGPAITATGVYRLEAGRGVSLVNNVQIGTNLAHRWRLRVVHSGAGNFTYGCEYSLTK